MSTIGWIVAAVWLLGVVWFLRWWLWSEDHEVARRRWDHQHRDLEGTLQEQRRRAWYYRSWRKEMGKDPLHSSTRSSSRR